MSSLDNTRPDPSLYIENGHDTALRKGAAFKFDPLTLAIGIAGVVEMRFLTGDNATVFEGANFGTDQEEVLFEVFEDVVFSAPGSLDATIIRKMNNMSLREPEIQVYTGPTVDTLGGRILHDVIRGAASQGQNKPGFGTGSQVNTIVLKPNTEHVFRITNASVVAVNVEAHVFYREVNPKQYAEIV